MAILHDGATYGKGLADETKAQLNKRGVTEATYEAYTPGKNDYSAEIAALQAADIAVLYVGGYHAEVALMARAARDRGYSLQLVSGDTLSTEDFALIAGPAAEGTLFTFGADPRQNAEAASVVERFRAEGYEPAGYTLSTYAAVQAWAQAVEKAGSLELPAVIASLRSHQFDTVPWADRLRRQGRPHRTKLGVVCLERRRVRAAGIVYPAFARSAIGARRSGEGAALGTRIGLQTNLGRGRVMRRFSAVAIVMFAAALGSPAEADILIGVAGPMTGDRAWYGEQMQRGAELAVADINAAGGVLGQQVQLITADDSCDPEQAVAAARKLVSQGVIFVVGHFCSGASIAASEIYEAAGVLQISPTSSNPMLTELGRANVFRVAPRDDASGILAGNYLADHWPGRRSPSSTTARPSERAGPMRRRSS